jgi:hypothetical protein
MKSDAMNILFTAQNSICQIAIAIMLASVVGCAPTKEAADESDDDVARSVVERGPLRVTAEVAPAQSRLSDEPTLTLTYEYETGVVVTKPPFGESLGEFAILGFREPTSTLNGDRQVEQQVYHLEPTTTGDLTIAPITITFRDQRPDGDGLEHQLETESLTITVTTMVGAEAPSLTDLRPPASPVKIPMEIGFSWLWYLFVPLAISAFCAWLWRRRKPSEVVQPRRSPREIAEESLSDLERSDLAQSDIKQFYVDLTGIVRRYLEQTTGVRAPEETTEEFLRDISNHNAYGVEVRNRLQEFLISADLVKFAGHQPLPEDVTTALERARRFVQTSWLQTRAEVAA